MALTITHGDISLQLAGDTVTGTIVAQPKFVKVKLVFGIGDNTVEDVLAACIDRDYDALGLEDAEVAIPAEKKETYARLLARVAEFYAGR